MTNISTIKILIIEDDLLNCRELIRETLEEHFGRGTVAEADSGAAALALDLGSYDLILSDYNLPDCTGLDLLGQIRACCTTLGDHGHRRERHRVARRGDPQARRTTS